MHYLALSLLRHQYQSHGDEPELGQHDDIVRVIAQPVQVDETKNKSHCPWQEAAGESWLGKHAAPQAESQDYPGHEMQDQAWPAEFKQQFQPELMRVRVMEYGFWGMRAVIHHLKIPFAVSVAQPRSLLSQFPGMRPDLVALAEIRHAPFFQEPGINVFDIDEQGKAGQYNDKEHQ